MSSSTNAPKEIAKIDRDMHVAIVRTLWNSHITGPLMDGAKEVFDQYGVTYECYEVPGAIELTYAAAKLAESMDFDAVVVLGCVIRGGTPHFDYVCQSVTQGITQINANALAPVIFGVLTVDNEQQALDRIGGAEGHKGREAAEAAIIMFDFAADFNKVHTEFDEFDDDFNFLKD